MQAHKKANDSNTTKGKLGESLAKEHLLNLGHKILESNFRSKFGEIDLISEKDSVLYCYEVKYRTPDPQFHPLQTFTSQKKIKMRKQAELFLYPLGKNSYVSVSFGLIYVPSDGQIEIFDHLF